MIHDVYSYGFGLVLHHRLRQRMTQYRMRQVFERLVRTNHLFNYTTSFQVDLPTPKRKFRTLRKPEWSHFVKA